MAKSSLDRLFEGQGLSGWDEIYPGHICGKCPMRIECQDKCAAIIVVGGLAMMSLISPTVEMKPSIFMENIKKVISKIK